MPFAHVLSAISPGPLAIDPPCPGPWYTGAVSATWEAAVAEPTIVCPKCGGEIRLTESLAAPLIEATRREYEERMATRDREIASREAAVREQRAELDTGP